MKPSRAQYVVIGGDSLVGGGLLRALQRRGHDPYSTTRRKETVSGRRVFLDFESPAAPRLPDDAGYAFVVAAATNYERCEKDPLAYRTNVEFIPRTIASLLEQGLFVTFVSTNSVFGGERPWPNEDDPHDAQIAYAKQKDEAERVVAEATQRLNAEKRINIVRLTKILDKDTSPIPAWLASWDRGEMVQPFSDLIFSPMSVRFVGEALADIGEKRLSGNLHLSGAANVTYADLAQSLAARLGYRAELIAPTTAVEKGINIPFKPRYSGLGMRRTAQLTGLSPQPLAAVVEDLAASMWK